MEIPFYNFKKIQTPDFINEVQKELATIFEANSFIEGHYNTLFEQEFAKFNGSKHCLLVGNGTDALEISLKAYNIHPGDYVGCPAITFHATCEAILNVGARPVLIDVDPVTGLMCPRSLAEIVEKDIPLKAIIPVHLYGLPAQMWALEEVCIRHDIKIIEDAAQAHGALVGGRLLGESKNLITFSFYPTKNIGAFGDAGAILTNSSDLARTITSLRNHGRDPDGRKIFGRNSRCDHIQALVLHKKLQRFEYFQNARKDLAMQLHNGLGQISQLELLPRKYLETSSWHLYPVKLLNKKLKLQFREFLLEKGIKTALFYETCLADEVPLAGIQGEFKQGKLFSERVLCLPFYPFMESEKVDYLIKSIGEFFTKFNPA